MLRGKLSYIMMAAAGCALLLLHVTRLQASKAGAPPQESQSSKEGSQGSDHAGAEKKREKSLTDIAEELKKLDTGDKDEKYQKHLTDIIEELKRIAEGNPLFKQFADSAIWTVVVFLVLLAVLGRFAWKPMMEGLAKREKSIHDALAEAKQAREDAVKLREQHQAQMSAAQEQVRAILEEGRRNSQQAADEMIAKARAESQAERERVRREMEVARDQALQDLTSWAAQLATLISTKAIHRQLTLDDHRRFVDEALADMKQTGQEQQQLNSLA